MSPPGSTGKPKVLVTPRTFGAGSPAALEKLCESGYEVVRNESGRVLDSKEVTALAAGCIGIIVGVDPLGRDVIQALPGLRAISKFGTGLDNIDVLAATARRIPVGFTPGANSVSVADLTIGLMLACVRSIPRASSAVKSGDWSRVLGRELAGMSLGIAGMGRIGVAVAQRASGFGMSIAYYDPATSAAGAEAGYRRTGSLAELLGASDVVSLHLPLSDATRELIGRDELASFRKGAYLVNTARSGVVDSEALYEALSSGWLAGAGIDVLEPGNPWDVKIASLDNVVATPHIGSHTVEAVRRMEVMAVRNLLELLSGGRPRHLVNPEVLEQLAAGVR